MTNWIEFIRTMARQPLIEDGKKQEGKAEGTDKAESLDEKAGTEKLERYGRAAFYSVLKDVYPQIEDTILRNIIETEQVEPHKVRLNALKMRCYIIDFAVPFINNKEPKEGFLELMQIMVDQKEKGNQYVEQIVAYGTVKNDEGTKDWAGWYVAK